MVAFPGTQGVLDPSSCLLLLCLTSVLYAVVTAAVRPEENMLTRISAMGPLPKGSTGKLHFQISEAPSGG